MADTHAENSPLARLVLFMVCLSIVGSILAGAHYVTVDLPAQKNIPAPLNTIELQAACKICETGCIFDTDQYGCDLTCKELACGSE